MQLELGFQQQAGVYELDGRLARRIQAGIAQPRFRNVQCLGECPLARQPGADRDPAVDDPQPDGIGEAMIGRAGVTGRPPVAQLACQKVHIERSHRHCASH